MSKRHHVHRRKAYGRRQHEVRERGAHRHVAGPATMGWDDGGAELMAPDALGFIEPRGGRLRFALGE
jgi:hypothetical protein